MNDDLITRTLQEVRSLMPQAPSPDHIRLTGAIIQRGAVKLLADGTLAVANEAALAGILPALVAKLSPAPQGDHDEARTRRAYLAELGMTPPRDAPRTDEDHDTARADLAAFNAQAPLSVFASDAEKATRAAQHEALLRRCGFGD